MIIKKPKFSRIHKNGYIRFLTIVILPMIFMVGCKNNDNTGKVLEHIQVKWKLIENKKSDGRKCVAEFTFINNSEKQLDIGNWKMFFNQNTLPIGNNPDDNKGFVEHINGDLYGFVPGPEFVLAPYDSQSVRYEYKGALIKERDAPDGIYFVLQDAKKKEIVILPEEVVVHPFDALELVFQDSDVLAAVPTAATNYKKNSSIRILPFEKVGNTIPEPVETRPIDGQLIVNDTMHVYYDDGLENEADYLILYVENKFGFSWTKTKLKDSGGKYISLELRPGELESKSNEAYQLKVDKGIQIVGNEPPGVFYAIQSFLSLIPRQAYIDKKPFIINKAEILDSPRFAYRGFLLDVARNFHKKEDIYRLIDLLSMYKLNKLNLRLTDDEGWRIEIAGLPELTDIGGKRGHTNDSGKWLPPSFGSGPDPESENNYGTGFYSREDFRDIITYAAQRHVQVIPEICFPSHARAAIMAMEARYKKYIQLGEEEKAEEFRLIDPQDRSVYLSAQMYKDNIVCVARPSVYRFYEKVVKDLILMYREAGLKLETFNTGGDEVPAGAWTESPLCRELLKELPEVNNPRQLQAYFLERMLTHLSKYDLQISGWEEIVLNKDIRGNSTVNKKFIGKNVLPLVWDNTGENIDLGYRIANAGYPVVLCNVSNLYFDLAYNANPREPGLYWGGFQEAIDPYVISPYDVYMTTNFDDFSRLQDQEVYHPKKERIHPQAIKNIIGLQAQLWSETLKGPKMLEYYMVPKLFAFAQKVWSQAPDWETEPDLLKRNAEIKNGWSVLTNQIGQRELPRLDLIFGNYNYRIEPPGAIIESGMLKANSPYPGLHIRFTTDGTDPEFDSKHYTGPVDVKDNVKIRSFNSKHRGSFILDVNK
jgi:hexosaminidase